MKGFTREHLNDILVAVFKRKIIRMHRNLFLPFMLTFLKEDVIPEQGPKVLNGYQTIRHVYSLIFTG